MQIKRSADNRFVKPILHRIADIPDGVTVSIGSLGGPALLEGTPICVGANGMYDVMKTTKVVTEYVNGTSLEIAKGSHFKVGDKIADEAGTIYANITAIDRAANADKDVVTLTAQFASGLAVGSKLVLATVVTNATHTGVAFAAAADNVKVVQVKKGHGFIVGDFLKGALITGKEIVSIDRGDDAFDTLNLKNVTGAVIGADEALSTVTAENGAAAKTYTVITKQAGPAVAIVGNNEDIVAGSSMWVPAWLIAVVREANAPSIPTAMKAQLSGIKFI